MSSQALKNAARQLERHRSKTSGTTVTFRLTPYTVRTEEVSGNKAGQAGATTIPAYLIGNTDARLFVFNASGFAPVTSVALPEVGEYITFLGWAYLITHTTAVTAGEDSTLGIYCYGLKKTFAG